MRYDPVFIPTNNEHFIDGCLVRVKTNAIGKKREHVIGENEAIVMLREGVDDIAVVGYTFIKHQVLVYTSNIFKAIKLEQLMVAGIEYCVVTEQVCFEIVGKQHLVGFFEKRGFCYMLLFFF